MTEQRCRQQLLQRALNNNQHEGFKAAHQLQEQRGKKEEQRRGRLQFLATPSNDNKLPPKLKLAIVGGGVAGLYAARLLEKSFPGAFDVTILEKDEGRVGGRIHTHKFSDDLFQYGEFGAMRIPAQHEKVINLFDELKLERIPFEYSNDESFFFINGTKDKEGNIMTKKYAEDHPEELGFMKININVPSAKIAQYSLAPEDFNGITLNLNDAANAEKYRSVVHIYDEIYEHLETELGNDVNATAAFLEKYDLYTVYSYFHEIIREWLTLDCTELPPKAKIEGLIESVLHYAEMTASATGLNHLALVESVLDGRSFKKGQQWWTLNHGMFQFTEALAKDLKETKIEKGAKVIRLQNPEEDVEKVIVTYEKKGILGTHKTHEETYDAVLVTSPFGSVRFMDIKVPFTYGKKQAIRSLNYDHSTKIFAQFSSRWWESKKQKGGATSTDLPVRTVVYPSYGFEDKGKGVLLASYTWQNDAIMWANVDERTKKQTILKNLEDLHNVKLNENEVQIATHTWLEAFSLFAPGQFQLMVNAMIPEFGVHFAGEHLSTYHAWIIGALNSATRAVREILVLEGVLSMEAAWEQFPDEEFTYDTWLDYMSHVKPPKASQK